MAGSYYAAVGASDDIFGAEWHRQKLVEACLLKQVSAAWGLEASARDSRESGILDGFPRVRVAGRPASFRNGAR